VASCPTLEAALKRLPGCTWGISGDADVRAWAAAIVERDLDGRVVTVKDEDRAAWHVAAVMTANGVAAPCPRVNASWRAWVWRSP
jgi:predicted short-subunit dehydrogenase-like oxidoreductase (DUF2520 family)